jgi:Holliday junction DNA helicase RuvB
MTFTMPDGFANGDYPTEWDDFIGQSKAKRQIQLAVDSATIRGKSMDHILIASGTPGIGKTSLALLAAQQMDADINVVSGKIDAGAANMLFADMSDGDVLFIDEAHKMVDGGKKDSEWLLHYLQDGILLGAYRQEWVPKVTVIAATTEVGRLPATVVGRFPVRPQLTAYSEEEGALIALSLARKVLDGYAELPTMPNCDAIAVAGNCNPRSIRQILVTIRDMAVTEMMPFNPVLGYDIDKVLDWHGITADGLDSSMQRYLTTLAKEFNGRVGQRAIEDRLQEPGGLAECERVLVEKHYITKTASGRQITVHGARRATALA